MMNLIYSVKGKVTEIDGKLEKLPHGSHYGTSERPVFIILMLKFKLK
jgi:hypothetical protein